MHYNFKNRLYENRYQIPFRKFIIYSAIYVLIYTKKGDSSKNTHLYKNARLKYFKS